MNYLLPLFSIYLKIRYLEGLSGSVLERHLRKNSFLYKKKKTVTYSQSPISFSLDEPVGSYDCLFPELNHINLATHVILSPLHK